MSSEIIYILKKSGVVLEKIDSKCSESAIDYFSQLYPGFLMDKSFKIEVEKIDFFRKKMNAFSSSSRTTN